jgi:hypothetical protein
MRISLPPLASASSAGPIRDRNGRGPCVARFFFAAKSSDAKRSCISPARDAHRATDQDRGREARLLSFSRLLAVTPKKEKARRFQIFISR